MKYLLLGLSCGLVAFSQTADQSYAGSWSANSDKSVKVVVEQTPDKIHVKEFKGVELRSEYTCGLSGKACKFKDGGHSATVTLWLDGPTLVALETRGDKVLERRFKLEEKGKTMDEEVQQISPPGDTLSLAYSRD